MLAPDEGCNVGWLEVDCPVNGHLGDSRHIGAGSTFL